MTKKLFSAPFVAFILCGTLVPIGAIAWYGLTDPSGRVLGLMPHPEAFHHVTNYPTWTRGSIDVPPATQLFSNAVRYLRAL